MWPFKKKKKYPPPYVPIILDHIRLQSYTAELENELREKYNLTVVQGNYGLEISYNSTTTPHFENEDLIEKLFILNKLGVLFGEDYKQMYSPAAFMRELQKREILKKSFTSIYWTGPDDFHYRENNG